MDKTEDNVEFGAHATTRMQQRGIRRTVAQMIVKYADREVHIGKGLMSVSILNFRRKILSMRVAST